MVRTEVIAEIGVNHDGVWTKALDLIDTAKRCGADTVKFQLFDSEKLGRPELKKYEFGLPVMTALKAHCRENQINFLCTPFDPVSVVHLVEMGVKRLKISSGCVTNQPLLAAAKASELPIILSTGMSTWDEMWDAYRFLGHPTILHCTSAYPTPLEDVNLKVLDRLPPPFGLSDHTKGILVAIAAVARGATVIEKHLTLNKHAEGPDHLASIEPHEFQAMVHGIRQIEEALGDGVKRPMPSEKETMRLWHRTGNGSSR